MQCDRAQEFFSDYLEHTLDRPMVVAIESHLAGCANCREEVESLQSTFQALESLPEVEPPADGAWQVMMAIRQQRAAQYEAERRKAPTFLEWLRTLNPLSVAMGASLATLAIGGSLLATGIPHVMLTLFPIGQQAEPIVRTGAPKVEVSYGPANGQSQSVEVRVTSAEELIAGAVQLTSDALPVPQAATGTIAANVPVVFNLQLPSNAGAQVLHVTARGQKASGPYESTIVVPFSNPSTEPMTVVLTDQHPADALRRVATNLGHPVVVDGPLPDTVTFQSADRPAAMVLQDLADQTQFTVRNEGGVYRLIHTN